MEAVRKYSLTPSRKNTTAGELLLNPGLDPAKTVVILREPCALGAIFLVVTLGNPCSYLLNSENARFTRKISNY